MSRDFRVAVTVTSRVSHVVCLLQPSYSSCPLEAIVATRETGSRFVRQRESQPHSRKGMTALRFLG